MNEQSRISKKIRVTIHRGTERIGGCVTEYACDGYKIFVDYGEQLPGVPDLGPLFIEGLTCGDLSKSILLLTHNHSDHVGKVHELSTKLPVYMGRVAHGILKLQLEHISVSKGERFREIKEKKIDRVRCLERAHFFAPNEDFVFGPFTIRPIQVFHSAFDSYAFYIRAYGVCVFHTGDFNMHTFGHAEAIEDVPRFIPFPKHPVDCLVTEATNVRDEGYQSAVNECADELRLQSLFFEYFKERKANIVYTSSTNIARVFAVYHAACLADRLFLVDAQQKRLMDYIVNLDAASNPDSCFYSYEEGCVPVVLPELPSLSKGYMTFRPDSCLLKECKRRGYVLIAKSGKKYDRLVKRMPGVRLGNFLFRFFGKRWKFKYLSMWPGYVERDNPAMSKSLIRSLGTDYVSDVHVNGHCRVSELTLLFAYLSPKVIIPIHTEAPDVFVRKFGYQYNIPRLHDGESIEIGE